MDPSEKNHYKFIYTRNTPFSFRFIGIFVVLTMFATIPLVVLSITKQTNENSHAAVLAASMTPTLTPPTTPTSTSGPTYASISFLSPAIGSTPPLHSTRLVTITLYNVDTQKTYTNQDTVTFDGVESFSNTHFALGSIPSGTYALLAAMPGNLQKLLTQTNTTSTFSIQAGSTLVIPAATLIPGDIAPIPGLNNQPYGDNILDIEDYNVLMGCYKSTHMTGSCNDVGKTAADLNDDGNVDAIDYNILLRSFATRDGDSFPVLSAIAPSANAVPTNTPTPTIAVTATPLLTSSPTPTTILPANIVPQNTTTLTPTPIISSAICSSTSNPQCSYATSCSTNGISCQCADKSWSGHDKVYQCQSGIWKYINDTTQANQYVCTSTCGSL